MLLVFGFGHKPAETLVAMGQILCCVSPGLPNEPELLDEESGKASRHRRGKKHRRKRGKSGKHKHRKQQPANNVHVEPSSQSRAEESDDGRVHLATDAPDHRGTTTLTEIGFPETEDEEDEEATGTAEHVGIDALVSPAKFAHCENPGVACALFRSHLAYHKDTLQVDAFGARTPSSHGTEQVDLRFMKIFHWHYWHWPIPMTVFIFFLLAALFVF